MKLNDLKIASDSSKKTYYYHMAVPCRQGLEPTKFTGCDYDWRKQKIRNYLTDRWPHFCEISVVCF